MSIPKYFTDRVTSSLTMAYLSAWSSLTNLIGIESLQIPIDEST